MVDGVRSSVGGVRRGRRTGMLLRRHRHGRPRRGVALVALATLAVAAPSAFDGTVRAGAAPARTSRTAPAASRGPAAVLGTVSCLTSTWCEAAGTYSDPRVGLARTLVEGDDGSGWTTQPTFNPRFFTGDVLNDISCGSPTSCVAVGWVGEEGPALIEQYDGAMWSLTGDQNPRGALTSLLWGVSCPRRQWCMAVGNQNGNSGRMPVVLTEVWNGRSWTQLPGAVPTGAEVVQFFGVSCTSPSDCMAVGNDGFSGGVQDAVAEHWDGTSWSVVPTPSLGTGSLPTLFDVSCSGRDCLALGTDYAVSLGTGQIAEFYNGSSWSVVRPAPPEPGATAFDLTGVACTAPRNCVAVGSWRVSPHHVVVTLIERFAGRAFTIVGSPTIRGGDTELSGISCPSPASCVAVGQHTTHAGGSLAIAAVLADGTWTLQRAKSPS